jgi:purine-binding chemotaxis protein CheW
MAGVDDTRKAAAGEGTGGQFATFFVDNLLFGVDVLRVQEVLRYQEMTGVPLAPDVIQGLINLRGQIVTAVDMRLRLGLAPRGNDRAPMNMVVQSDDGAVSLLVDEIGDVLQVEEAAFEAAPENVDPRIRELTTGMYKLKDRLLLVLDTVKAIDVTAAGSDPGLRA